MIPNCSILKSNRELCEKFCSPPIPINRSAAWLLLKDVSVYPGPGTTRRVKKPSTVIECRFAPSSCPGYVNLGKVNSFFLTHQHK